MELPWLGGEPERERESKSERRVLALSLAPVIKPNKINFVANNLHVLLSSRMY